MTAAHGAPAPVAALVAVAQHAELSDTAECARCGEETALLTDCEHAQLCEDCRADGCRECDPGDVRLLQWRCI